MNTRYSRASLLLLLSSITAIGPGCANMSARTKIGAITGAVVCATAGGIIGHQSGRGLEGAGVGAAIGAVAGGVTGEAMDQRANEAAQLGRVEVPANPAPTPGYNIYPVR
jgi:outer membrane lipoprotein SlyB